MNLKKTETGDKDAGQAKPNPEPADKPKIDGFELLERIGHSSESSLWKACQISLGRTVVIKVLSEKMSRDSEDIKQFQFEAKVAASLKHHGIVQVYDFGQSRDNGRPYFVMEHITGYSVGDWVRRKGRLSELDSLTVVHCVADALGYAWKQGRVVHCDIKPDNIMVDGDGTIKVTDLGLARVVRSLGGHPDGEDQQVMGTPNYMSPEQAKGQKHLDFRSDIYSTGATLYQLLTGVLPFGCNEVNETLRRQIHDDLEYPRKIAPGISPGTADFVMKMMAKNPARRPQSWEELIGEVSKLQLAARAPGGGAVLEKVNFSGQTMPVAFIDSSEVMECPHCAKLVKKKSGTCSACGKSLEAQASVKKPTVKKKASAVVPRARKTPKSAPLPIAEVRRRSLKKNSGLGENLTLLGSLLLLVFLAFYGYQRMVNRRDILDPMRKRIQSGVMPNIGAMFAEIGRSVSGFLPERSLSPDKDGRHPGDPGGARPDMEDPAFLRILRECKQESPAIGDMTVVKLKGQDDPVQGTLKRLGISGIMVGVEHGEIMCPFTLMDEDDRMQFFPEERARIIWKARKEKKTAASSGDPQP